MKRNVTIDFCRGILIILVIVGHVWPGILRDTLPRYMIYSVHIPLFFGLSGYLNSFEKLRKYSTKKFLSILYNLLVNWGVAVFVIYLLRNYNSLSIGGLILNFIRPYYHLWYIPSYLLFIGFTYIILKFSNNFQLSKKFIILLAIFLYLLGSYYRVYTSDIVGKVILHFQFDNYIYLVLGMVLYDIKQMVIKIPFNYLLFLSSMTLFLRVCMFYTDWLVSVEHSWYYLVIYIPLMIFLVKVFWEDKKIPCYLSPVIFIGKESLPIYLYHVIPIMVSNKILETLMVNSLFIGFYMFL